MLFSFYKVSNGKSCCQKGVQDLTKAIAKIQLWKGRSGFLTLSLATRSLLLRKHMLYHSTAQDGTGPLLSELNCKVPEKMLKTKKKKKKFLKQALPLRLARHDLVNDFSAGLGRVPPVPQATSRGLYREGPASTHDSLADYSRALQLARATRANRAPGPRVGSGDPRPHGQPHPRPGRPGGLPAGGPSWARLEAPRPHT